MKANFYLLLLMAAVCCTACQDSSSNNEPTPTTQLDLMGTWRSVTKNGELLPTNERTVLSYISANKFTMSMARYVPEYDILTWRNKYLGDYTFDGVNLVQSAADPQSYYSCQVKALGKTAMWMYYNAYINDKDIVTPMSDTLIYERVLENLGWEEAILGKWQGVKHTGLETYGDEHHQWEYRPMDSQGFCTYVYYNYDEGKKEWVAALQAQSEYNVHGSWLATRWIPSGSSTFNHEWWDIDFITDSTMQWSAWRTTADTSYLATFTFRRVD